MDANLLQYVTETAELLRNLPKYYQAASLPIKQKLIGSICVKKLVYENGDYRTIEFNDIIQGICRLSVHFDSLEKEQASISGSLSEEVNQDGMFSNQLREDLRNFSQLNNSPLHTYVPIM